MPNEQINRTNIMDDIIKFKIRLVSFKNWATSDEKGSDKNLNAPLSPNFPQLQQVT